MKIEEMLSLYKKLQHLFSCIRYTAKHELDIELTNLFLSLIFKKRIKIAIDVITSTGP